MKIRDGRMQTIIAGNRNVTVFAHVAQPFEAAVVVTAVSQFDDLCPGLGENKIGQAGSMWCHDDFRGTEGGDLLRPGKCLRIDDGEAAFAKSGFQLDFVGQ